jgi:predicted nucleic acid-binding Zn finger protein
MDGEMTDRELLTSRFQRYAYLGKTFEKAIDAVVRGYVKAHIFVPSERAIYTVVGSSGDEFIDPEKPYCSCGNFFFRVMGGKREYCYHILGYRMALEAEKIEKITFDDEEYSDFFRIVTIDVLDNLKETQGSRRKGG